MDWIVGGGGLVARIVGRSGGGELWEDQDLVICFERNLGGFGGGVGRHLRR